MRRLVRAQGIRATSVAFFAIRIAGKRVFAACGWKRYLSSGDKEYLVSIQTIGYGHLWPEEDEDDDYMFEADSAEIQRESLEPGSRLYFRQDPDIPKDSAWLDVVASNGEKLCDIPW